jgi:hypothetical protein
MKIIEILGLSFIFLISATLGILYSVYNTDPHHWGFIAGTVLDYIHGKQFFTDIYVQYGIGEPILFKFLNLIVPINYTSIGIFTSFAYALNLLIIYLSIKKLCNTTIALLLTFIIFQLHPYAIYPWPDYWAGLSLSLACFFLIHEKEEKASGWYAISGVLLFIAFLFRNTYLMSISAAGLSYLIFCVFNKNIRNKNIFITLVSFWGLFLIYLFWLSSNHTLQAWYEQSLGAGTTQYGVGVDNVLLLLKRVFLPAKFWLPNNQVTTTISALFYLSFYTLYLLLFKVRDKGIYVFLILLGLAGIVQATLGYELFRIQNACSPLYLGFAIFLGLKLPNALELLKRNKIKLILGIYLLLLVIKFPYSSSLFPLYEGTRANYNESKIPFYRWHRFQSNMQKYYDDLALLICDAKSRIVNRTPDSSIPYLCPNQENAFALPFYNESMLIRINAQKFAQMSRGEFNANDIIVVEASTKDIQLPLNSKVKLIEVGKVIRPKIQFYGNNTITVYRVNSQPTL